MRADKNKLSALNLFSNYPDNLTAAINTIVLSKVYIVPNKNNALYLGCEKVIEVAESNRLVALGDNSQY